MKNLIHKFDVSTVYFTEGLYFYSSVRSLESVAVPGTGFESLPLIPAPAPLPLSYPPSTSPENVPQYSLQFWPQFPLGRITPAEIEENIREASRVIHYDGKINFRAISE